MMLALERGEISGLGAMNVATPESEFPDLIKESKINFPVQVTSHIPTIVADPMRRAYRQ
jgi:hypothetical protein